MKPLPPAPFEVVVALNEKLLLVVGDVNVP
jgi:hypothetical protein